MVKFGNIDVASMVVQWSDLLGCIQKLYQQGTCLNPTQRGNNALNRPLYHHRRHINVTKFNHFNYYV